MADPFDFANADAPAPAGGMSPDFWHNLMMFGGSLAAGANARTPQGFLQYGPGFGGPFGAALMQTGQQGLETAKAKSSLAAQGAATQGQRIQNQVAALGLPLAQMRARAASDPAFMQQMMGGAPQLPEAPQDQSSATPAPASSTGGGATIGQRQNNPGNLMFAGQPGASPGQGNRFAAFPDMATGVAANADQLSLYQTQHGINTVRGAVTRWVGDPKADLTGSGPGSTAVKPGSYIGDISKSLGVGPDDPIDLTNPMVQAKFIQAQFPHESAGGGFVLNPADVAKGVQLSAANRGRVVQAGGQPSFQVAQAGNGPVPIPGQQPQPQGAPSAATQQQTPGQPQQGNIVPGQGAFSPGYITPQQAFQRADASRQQAIRLQMLGFDATPATQQAQAWQEYGQKQLLQQTQPQSIRGPGSATFNPATGSVLQSPLEYEVTGPDMRKYRITQNAVETGQPYQRPAGVPAWAPPGTLSVAQAEPSPGEHKAVEDAAADAFGEKARSQYSSAAGTLRTMEDMEQQVDRLNAGGPDWYNTGAGAAAKLDFAKQVNGLAQSVGAPPIFDPDKLASGEDVTKQAKLAGMQVLSTMFGGSREAASIIHSTQAAVPNIENTPQGFKLLVNGYKEAARWQMDQHAFMTNWYAQHAGNMVGADVAFAQQNRPEMYTRRGISQVRPYEIPGSDPAELKRFLPGTQVIVKADPTHTPRIIPGDTEIPLQMPQQQPALGAPPQ